MAIILLIGVLWGTYYYVQLDNKSSNNPDIEMCKNEVMSVLKSPSTAVFGTFDTTTDNIASYVRWEVDSQNTFWGVLRMKFVCVINWFDVRIVSSEGDRDEINELEILNSYIFNNTIPTGTRAEIYTQYMKDIAEINLKYYEWTKDLLP